MEIAEREETFSNAVRKELAKPDHVSPCYGTSNIARMVPGGIVVGVSNLDNFSADAKSIGLLSRLCPLPNAELYIGAVIQSGISQLRKRLKEMLTLSTGGDTRFGERNNNVSLCLGPESRVFAHNKKISELNMPPQAVLGAPIPVDQVYYAIYCPQATKEEQEVLRAILKAVREFVGATRMTELALWTELRLIAPGSPTKPGALGKLAREFEAALVTAKLKTSPDLGGRLIASLLAKPFVILSGLSGSGKTKVAQAVADWLTDDPRQSALVPVGADWTNRENLLGYPDALNVGEYRLPPSSVLQLIVSAIAESKKESPRPYFLILDEMNLSHVERYFADVLSVMESGREIRLHEPGSAKASDGTLVPAEIALPPNLFIIGTVNVDETTYMFSPKVLDRANVIEFGVTRDAVLDFLDDPPHIDLARIQGKGKLFATAFVAEAQRKDVSIHDIKDGTGAAAQTVLSVILGSVFDALEPIGAEFAYRPLYEISRFIYFYSRVADEDWTVDGAIDAAIMQKLLPKLNGSKTKLTPVLSALGKVITKDRFPISATKIERMVQRLKQNGFTSYPEA